MEEQNRRSTWGPPWGRVVAKFKWSGGQKMAVKEVS